MKKRAVASDQLPRWAVTQIRQLSSKSGVSFEKLRDMVLRFGIYQTKEELAPLITLMQSAEALGRIDEGEEPVDTQVDAEQNVATNGETQPETAASTDSGSVGAVLFEHTGTNGDSTSSDHVSERRDDIESGSDSDDFVGALSGD